MLSLMDGKGRRRVFGIVGAGERGRFAVGRDVLGDECIERSGGCRARFGAVDDVDFVVDLPFEFDLARAVVGRRDAGFGCVVHRGGDGEGDGCVGSFRRSGFGCVVFRAGEHCKGREGGGSVTEDGFRIHGRRGYWFADSHESS